MNDIVGKLKILLRAEKMLYKAEAQRRASGVMLMAMSIGCVFVALVFVNMGVFFELTASSVSSQAAFMLAGGNLLIAMVPLWVSRQLKPGAEEGLVQEIRDMALQDITRDVDNVTQQVASVGSGLKQLGSGGSPLAALGGLGALGGGGGLNALGPMLSMVIEMLKKRKK
jgi:hypothetical protein